MSTILNNTEVHNLNELLAFELAKYEAAVQEAAEGGLLIVADKDFPEPYERWSILQAVFFSSTVLTTIGYGNIVPVTTGGRVFCICFALIGIPFTLTVIADWGRLFATAVSVFGKHMPSKPYLWQFSSDSQAEYLFGLGDPFPIILHQILGTKIFLNFFKKFPGGPLQKHREWPFERLEGHISGNSHPILKRSIFLDLGIHSPSFCIKTSGQKFFSIFSKNFQGTLRRLGETAGTGLDYTALQKVLTVSMPKWNTNKKNEHSPDIAALEAITNAILKEVKEAQNNKPKVLQIVIYESSV
ncbi:hypothetical protein KR067_010564 [Drosophila pandora]|nr:hypothetical protein KR067_010564 [Drosophila pandora]